MISLEIAHPNDVIRGKWKHVASVETQEEILDILRFPDFLVDSPICAKTKHDAFIVTHDRIVDVYNNTRWIELINNWTMFEFWVYCRAGTNMIHLVARALPIRQVGEFLAYHVKTSIEKSKGCNVAAEYELECIERWISRNGTQENVFEAKHRTRSARNIVDGLPEVLGYATDALSTIVLSGEEESIYDSALDVIHYIGLAESIRQRTDLRQAQTDFEICVVDSIRARIPFYDIAQGILKYDLPH